MNELNRDIRCYLTNAGRQAELDAIANGTELEIVGMVIDAGLLADEDDPKELTAVINAADVPYDVVVKVDGDNGTLTVISDIPSGAGVYSINGYAWMTNTGVLYAYARGMGDVKRPAESGQNDVMRIEVEIATDYASTITHTYDDTQLFATVFDLNEKSIVMSEAQSLAIRNQNKERFAASDFVYHGQARANYSSINQGMWATDYNGGFTVANAIRIGDKITSPSPSAGQTSKYPYPLFNASGVIMEIKNISEDALNLLQFPAAQDGTVTYDSATGVVTDFTKDAAPQYAGVTGYETLAERAALSGYSEHNEAVASAFEGLVRNGDFRFGDDGSFVKSGSDTGTYSIDTTGLTLNGDYSGTSYYIGVGGLGSILEGTEFNIEIYVESITSGTINFSQGTNVSAGLITLKEGLNQFSVVWGRDGTDRPSIKVGSADAVAYIKSISVRPVTNEVVTERVDMTGLEIWAEEITDDEVFPFCIQNLSTTFGDTEIATVDSSRASTYFAVYDGQSSVSQGKCVLWSTLTDEEKKQVANYLGESFFIGENGNLVQWRVRNRSIAGAGNGDWNKYPVNTGGQWDSIGVNPSTNRFLGYKSHANSPVRPQGVLDDASGSVSYYKSAYAYADTEITGKLKSHAVYVSDNVSSNAYNSECYFYVLATVPRLNKGAYHPELNPMGAKYWNRTDSGARCLWYESTAPAMTSKSQAFHDATYDWSTGGVGFRTDSGYISVGYSGRPDGKYYDAIYSSGQGGVIDHRLKYGAWDASSAEQAAVVREEVKNGTYRGREQLLYTRVYAFTKSGGFYNGNGYWIGEDGNAFISDSFPYAASNVGEALSGSDIAYDAAWIVRGDTGEIQQVRRQYRPSGYTYFNVTNDIPDDTQVYLVYQQRASAETKPVITVEGEFSHIDVIGAPANILLTDALKDGWLGSWIPVIPDSTSQAFPLTRKAISTGTRQATTDNGATWSNYTAFNSFSAVTNDETQAFNASHVWLLNYTAFAKQTEQSENLAVLNGLAGLLPVFHSFRYLADTGVFLGESTLGVIAKSERSGEIYGDYSITKLTLVTDLITTVRVPFTHEEILAPAPTNDSHAGKYLFHQIEENDQANLNIIANELVYDSSSFVPWGDNSTVKVAASSTFTDLNGNTCKSNIHKLAKPYGWIKNNI